jgi:hypothetical protein
MRDIQSHQIYNHVAGVQELGQKSNLYLNLRQYYKSREMRVTEFLPETYVIKLQEGFKESETFQEFKQACVDAKDSVWIYKPAEVTNQGHGIKVLQGLAQIEQHITSELGMEYRFSNVILQRYILDPLLVH